jgi:general secretion pathway protein D
MTHSSQFTTHDSQGRQGEAGLLNSRTLVIRRLTRFGLIVALATSLAACAAGRAFRQGDDATRKGNLDQAVAYYRTAVQAEPENARYKISLERAMQAASRAHLDRAHDFEEKDQLQAALGEYRMASELDPTNRFASSKVASLDQTIRERIEAARPKPPIEQMRERARQASAPPILNPASREPLRIQFTNVNVKDILAFIAKLTGINVMYDRDVTDRPASVDLSGVTLEQALNQILATNQLAYKVVDQRTILIFPDTSPKHALYDEQVVRTFYLSHADPTEVAQLLSNVIRLPGIAVQPAIVANKTANAVTVRATTAVADIIERVIQQNDKPRAEIVIDVEILEVDRARAKTYGLNLSEYALGGIFSPEVSPSGTTTTTTGGTGTGTTATGGTSTTPSGVKPPPPFNLNTISRGVTTADFYMAVPTAIVRFLESDTHSKLVAKPQLRGAEGTKLTLKLGDSIPVISTSYTPIATGGAGINPLSSYQYKDVGINIDMTPRVTLEGDIILDLTVDDSSLGNNISVAGVSVPSFGQRTVTTRLRLRDGESNLLAGLLREDERRSLTGFPGAIHVPLLKQLFSANDNSIQQTDIVMLLTPHIVRTQEITEADLRPIYIGSQQQLGLGGPPPLIAAPEGAAQSPAPTAGAVTPPVTQPPAPAGTQSANPSRLQPAPTYGAGTQPYGTQPLPPVTTASGAVVAVPPGSSPVPGTVLVPQSPPPAVAATPEAVAPAAGVPATSSASPQPAAPSPDTTTAPPAATAQTAPDQATTSVGMGLAQVLVSPPATTFRVGGGPYTVPISIVNAARLSTVTLTLTFDPSILRVRTVQEGSFMRTGGVNATFTQQVGAGRIDITILRSADATGASGTGLLAAVLFETVAPGSTALTLSGSATGPGGTPMGLQFRPVAVAVQ